MTTLEPVYYEEVELPKAIRRRRIYWASLAAYTCVGIIAFVMFQWVVFGLGGIAFFSSASARKKGPDRMSFEERVPLIASVARSVQWMLAKRTAGTRRPQSRWKR